jgi:hypothetical protein
MHSAAWGGQEAAAHVLVEAGADPGAGNDDGNTPLMEAASLPGPGTLSVVRYLASLPGVDLAAVNRCGYSAEQVAQGCAAAAVIRREVGVCPRAHVSRAALGRHRPLSPERTRPACLWPRAGCLRRSLPTW